ncbi:hypothetical protein [Planktothrix sp. FACHB-1365]|uniref:hypothetical protein n=1 Tax=Planktothrix sp. FACHB-1365 TaxID=2692855 RepID=UPI001687C55C|nr:hypothetical protein [Planktothrix sp. FACHB-1365]MBD2485161.1 hypothetical protein [Planktothrix sp. FACHB-1365]
MVSLVDAIAILLSKKLKKYLTHPSTQCYENMTLNPDACPHPSDIIKNWLFIDLTPFLTLEVGFCKGEMTQSPST